MSNYADLSSERLNHDANLLLGCSLKELLLIFFFTGIFLAICLISISFLLCGRMIWGIFIFLVSWVPCAAVYALKIGRIKKNKPLFYCEQWWRRNMYLHLKIKDSSMLKMGVYVIARELVLKGKY
jgi:hypothetical protein